MRCTYCPRQGAPTRQVHYRTDQIGEKSFVPAPVTMPLCETCEAWVQSTFSDVAKVTAP